MHMNCYKAKLQFTCQLVFETEVIIALNSSKLTGILIFSSIGALPGVLVVPIAHLTFLTARLAFGMGHLGAKLTWQRNL